MKTMNWEIVKPVSGFPFVGNQAERAETEGATHAFRWRYCAGDVNSLPLYVLTAIKGNGFRPVYLGGTTYSYSIIGLVPNKQ